MNNKIDAEIRKGIAWAQENNIRIVWGGPWFIFNAEGNATSADAIGTILLMHGKVPAGMGLDTEDLVRPGFIKAACEILGVDPGWLHRFFMGYDRGYQVMLIGEKDKEIKDEVSWYGITLQKELSKKK